jgi:hypothetical protein
MVLKAAGKATINPTIVVAKIHALETAVQRLTQVYQQNTDAVSRAFMLTDAHLFVLKMITQDLAAGTVHYTEEWKNKEPGLPPIDSDHIIDLPFYYNRFNQIMAKRSAAMQQAKTSAPKEEEFGGDYGKTKDNCACSQGHQEQGTAESDGHGRDEKTPVPTVP